MREFAGNRRLVALLRKGVLPPAALFAGPSGVGKKTLALLLAAETNCRQPGDDGPCGECSSCVKALVGNHPDILLFEPERNLIRVEAMRRLNQEAHYRPFEGKGRFFIVDEAEKMNDEAANSVLKILEEPPPTSRMILISAFRQSLLPTIRSRCQTFTFKPLERRDLEQQLVTRGLDPEEASLRAGFAEGSLGRALALDAEQLLEDRDLVLDLLQRWSARESFPEIFGRCEEEPLRANLKKRERTREYLTLLEGLLEDVYFLQVGTPRRVLNQDRSDQLQQVAAATELQWVQRFLYHVDRARWEVDHYVNPLMCFETLWLMNRHAADRHGQVRRR